MKVELLRSSVDSAGLDPPCQFATTFLINDTLAVDAGTLGFHGEPTDQARVRHVLISHTHIDHVASLPIFVENAYEAGPDCATIHGSDAVLESMRLDLFNDRLWPDFIALSAGNPHPFLKLGRIEAEQTFELEGLRITPVPVNHVVPTLGFVIEDADSAIVIVSDTGPTDAIWEHANRVPHLKAVFLEATFPDSMAGLAEVSKHLTPALFAREARKLHQPAELFAVHIKARFRLDVIAELKALNLPNLHIAEFGKTYHF